MVALSLLVAPLAAYALARLRFRGRGALLAAILAVSMFPQVAILSGMFELIRALGLYNRLPSLTLSYLVFTLPFTIWILTTFMRELPRELEEAARVDGAGPWQTLALVLAPLLAPAMVTAGLLGFIAAWNEFLFALTFTLTDSERTVPVAIALMSGASQYELPWGNLMAASVIVTLPLVALVLAFQRRIVAGLTAGAPHVSGRTDRTEVRALQRRLTLGGHHQRHEPRRGPSVRGITEQRDGVRRQHIERVGNGDALHVRRHRARHVGRVHDAGVRFPQLDLGHDGLHVRADLVGRVPVRGDPVRPHEDEVPLAPAQKVSRRAVREDRMLDPFLDELPCGQARPLQPGSGLAHVDEELAAALVGHAQGCHGGPVGPRGESSFVAGGQDERAVLYQPLAWARVVGAAVPVTLVGRPLRR